MTNHEFEIEDGSFGYTDAQIDLLKRAKIRFNGVMMEEADLESKGRHDQVAARLLQVSEELKRMGQDSGLPEIDLFAKVLFYFALLSRLGDAEQ